MRCMTYDEIVREFGELVEIEDTEDGGWNFPEIAAAREAGTLWTQVDPGLLSSGYHWVNRERYLRSEKPVPEGMEIVEQDDDIDTCERCGVVLSQKVAFRLAGLCIGCTEDVQRGAPREPEDDASPLELEDDE